MHHQFGWIRSTFFFVVGILFLIQVGFSVRDLISTNEFNQTANRVVATEGGLTKRSYQILQEYSQQHYRSRFTVYTDAKKTKHYDDKQVDVGTKITFYVGVKIHFWIPWFAPNGIVEPIQEQITYSEHKAKD